MTQNQLTYARNVETERANRAQEELTRQQQSLEKYLKEAGLYNEQVRLLLEDAKNRGEYGELYGLSDSYLKDLIPIIAKDKDLNQGNYLWRRSGDVRKSIWDLLPGVTFKL